MTGEKMLLTPKEAADLVVERRYEPASDTEDRIRRALAILLDEEPHQRPGEAA